MNREVETHLETSLCNVVLRLFKLWSPGVEFGHHKGGGGVPLQIPPTVFCLYEYKFFSNQKHTLNHYFFQKCK